MNQKIEKCLGSSDIKIEPFLEFPVAWGLKPSLASQLFIDVQALGMSES